MRLLGPPESFTSKPPEIKGVAAVITAAAALWQGDFARRQCRAFLGWSPRLPLLRRRRNWCVCGPVGDRQATARGGAQGRRARRRANTQSDGRATCRRRERERGRGGGRGGFLMLHNPTRMFLHFKGRLPSRQLCIMDLAACCVEIIDINVTDGAGCIRRPRGRRRLMSQSLCSHSARCIFILFIHFFFALFFHPPEVAAF